MPTLRYSTARTTLAAALIALLALPSLRIPAVAAAGSFSPTVLVNTEAFMTVDDTDIAANVVIKFGDTLAKTITYNRTASRFEFNAPVSVRGNLSGATLNINSLQNCDTIDTDADGRLICGTDAQGGGGGGDWSGTGALQNAFDGRYVNTSGDTMTGALLMDQEADAVSIDIDSEATANPALRIDIAGDSDSPHLQFGAGGAFDTNLFRSLADTLATDDSFLVGTDLTVNGNATLGDAAADTVTFNAEVTGNVIPSADNTYTMGGTTDRWSTIYGTNSDISGTETVGTQLNVDGNTALGNEAADTVTFNAEVTGNVIPSADNTYTMGGTSDRWSTLYGVAGDLNADLTINSDADTNDAQLTFGNQTANQTMKYANALQRFELSKELWVNENVGALGDIASDADVVINADEDGNDAVLTFGNTTLNQSLKFSHANQRFQFSTDVSIAGNISGATLNVNSLQNCDTIDTDADGRLTCGTDAQGGGGGGGDWSGTGALQNAFDSRYVNQSGDGMTGSLMIKNGGPKLSADTGLLLEVVGAASGRIIHAQDRLAGSGVFVLRTPGSTAPTIYANGSNKVGIGTASPETQLEVIGSMSGRLIHSQNRLSSSGVTVLGGTVTLKPSGNQTISAAGNSILANAARVVLDPNADYTMTSVPTIADGFPGQVVVLTAANGEANYVRLQDENVLAATNLELDAPTRMVTGNKSLTLMFDGTDWIEIASSEDRLKTAALAADQSNSTTTLTELTGLSQTISPGTYVFQYFIRYQAAATTTGVRYAVNYTGTTTFFIWNWRGVDVSAAASTAAADQDEVLATGAVQWNFASRAKSTTTRGTTLSVDTANADMFALVEGVMTVTTAGDLELWHGSEVAAASTTKAGTSLILTKID